MDLLNPEELVSATNTSQGRQNEESSEHHCCHEDSVRKSHHSEKTKSNLITRLNRIEGQIRGIKGLIEKDTYCDDVITQISATQAALNSVAKILFEGHMKSCVIERIQEGDDEVIDELLVTIQRLMKK
ncbi:CsoR family transcriptional regulator [Neobacillus notoginsengisoli]|uniref:CsoR family transcriptional regulator n=1 Tax=Neobacillus notoginsengisoli TaxID=1578198 RepID=A0A417YSA6_9BACI|nr:metal-sensitive transcriptional regulator [Neobacillus notoginsengisoli]RHW38885.1 CsoR family transcriptional regulator [Neobacillus notoginsengisoli]